MAARTPSTVPAAGALVVACVLWAVAVGSGPLAPGCFGGDIANATARAATSAAATATPATPSGPTRNRFPARTAGMVRVRGSAALVTTVFGATAARAKVT